MRGGDQPQSHDFERPRSTPFPASPVIFDEFIRVGTDFLGQCGETGLISLGIVNNIVSGELLNSV